jgi:CubicO group peptidase (beta-lactamase class C family)
LGQFAGDPLDFEPGTKMQYTSYGYIVLGCVLEGASGVSYDRYMRQAIFDPAQMPATRLDDVFAIIPHRARGYKLLGNGEVQNASFVDVSNKPPGSGINSTVRDMGAFVAALYSGKLVSKATLERMLTPSNTRDGMVWAFSWAGRSASMTECGRPATVAISRATVVFYTFCRNESSEWSFCRTLRLRILRGISSIWRARFTILFQCIEPTLAGVSGWLDLLSNHDPPPLDRR